MNRLLFSACPFFLACSSVLAQDPTIQALGVLNPANPFSRAKGVSADGNVVVGETRVGSVNRAFSWTPQTVMVDLGAFEPTGSSSAEDVSDNGNVVVGYALHAPGGEQRAFRWTGSGMQDLGTIADAEGFSSATGVNADGSVVVGDSSTMAGTRAFRWTASGMLNLGTFQNQGEQSSGTDVSADGTSVVGYSALPNDPGTIHAFRWRPGQGMVDLGAASGLAVSAAFGVSPDGQNVVGILLPSLASESYRAGIWTAADGMRAFDDSTNHAARDVSADGRVVVGEQSMFDGFGLGALIWINGERRQLEDVLEEAGVPLSEWSELKAAYAVSADGRVVVGYGRSVSPDCDMAFRAVLPNRAPIIEGLQPVAVECKGDRNLVTLVAAVSDGESATVTVQWRVNGVLSKTQPLASGATAAFQFDYPDGESDVALTVHDGQVTTTEGTTVTVSDTTDPVVVIAPNLTLPVEKGRLFALRTRLPAPNVTDVCDEAPRVSNDASARLPIGRSVVHWTAVDANGNLARATQRVKVINARPDANAGRDLRKTTRGSEIRVTLNGTKSKDPDRHKLTYAWKAPGIAFVNATTAKPIGTFPVGTTTVTLTVTDQAGTKSTDKVRVIVRRVVKRSESQESSAYVARAYAEGRAAIAHGSFDPATTAGYQSAAVAYALGSYAAVEDSSVQRAVLRHAQTVYSRAAGDDLMRAYLSGSSDDALGAAVHSYYGAIHGSNALAE